MRREPVAFVALAALAVGAMLLVFFDQWFIRAIAVLALFAFIVTGVFAIATPAFLADDDEPSPPGPK